MQTIAMAKRKPRKKGAAAVDPMLKRLGDRIREARLPRKQETFATQANVVRNIVSNIERGKNYEVKNLVKVLRALPGDLEDLIDVEGMTEKQREAHRKLHEVLQQEEQWADAAMMQIDVFYGFLKERKSRGL